MRHPVYILYFSETRLVEVFEDYACKNEDKTKEMLKELGVTSDKENEHRVCTGTIMFN